MTFLVAPTNITNGNPSVSNGKTAGFLVGSRWFNTVTGIEYVCQDNTDGSAVWNQVGQGSVSIAVDQVAFGSGTDTIQGNDKFKFTAANGLVVNLAATGVDNLTIGSTAGNSLTSGARNTLLGTNAGTTISIADDNIAIGYNALAVSTGSDNVAIGSGAADAVTSSSTIVAIGYNALGAGTNGVAGCTAIGSQALLQTTGTNNTGVGNSAGSGITSGTNNTCIGASTGAIQTGNYNVVIGAAAAVGTTLSNNIAIGYSASCTGAGVANSIALGYDASTSQQQCIVIGSQASSTAANQLVIGGVSTSITAAFIGKGVTSTTAAATVTLGVTGGSGTNSTGSSLVIAGGRSTGNITGGSVTIQTAPAGASSSTPGTLTTRVVIQGDGDVKITNTTAASSSITGAVVIGDGSTAAINVGIGGGNIFAGGNVNVTGNVVVGSDLGTGGKLRVNGNIDLTTQINAYPGTNNALEIINRSTNGGISLYTNGGAGAAAVVIEADNDVVIWTDTGGTEKLRVGGGIRASGAVTVTSQGTTSISGAYQAQYNVIGAAGGVTGLTIRRADETYGWSIHTNDVIGGDFGIYRQNSGFRTRVLYSGSGTTLQVPITTGSTSSITGSLIIGDGSTAATNVGIGEGIIYAGTALHTPLGYLGELSGANRKQIMIGYNALATSKYSIQGVEQGIAYRDLHLNELGGNVYIGSNLVAIAYYYGRILDPVAIPITSASDTPVINSMHRVTGTSADYTITLPPAGDGDVIGFMVGPRTASDKQYTLDAGIGCVIVGRDRYLTLIHTNVVLLRYHGSSNTWYSLVCELDTPWVDAGVITITAVTTNPTKGTTTVDKYFWRRVGDSCEMKTYFYQTVAGTAGSGTYRLGLPFAYDTAKVVRVAEGTSKQEAEAKASLGFSSMQHVGSVDAIGSVIAHTTNNTTVSLVSLNGPGTVQYLWGSAIFQLTLTPLGIHSNFNFPVTNW